jgi:crotonobetainyl-CoA:carnitine CoA-transferase CaiB-like acyl-CoA transferase
MVSGVRNLLTIPLATLRGDRRQMKRGNELLSGAYACYNLYRALDGHWLAVGALEPEFWGNLCRQLGCEDLVEDQFSPDPRQSELKTKLAQIFTTRTARDWFELLRNHDCCVTPLRCLQEALDDGYFDSKQIVPTLSETPADPVCASPPAIGEHSFEILQQLGLSVPELHVLQTAGVVQSSSREVVPAGTPA